MTKRREKQKPEGVAMWKSEREREKQIIGSKNI